ncbi:serine/threonine-protein kinase haspin-like isoform X2 [Uloborus diversus]|uniref:serine/threonine-protein kinase haspin-like isoform X2 n=1 Tax=Uloborus diversus TaxID=327109 RepID=UPI0024093545|nr:serine/threonine-protein kinase haspin-like isoform X2 [Uloborus diversus]
MKSVRLSRRNPVVPRKLKKNDKRENVSSVLRLADLQCPVPFWFAAPELELAKLSSGSRNRCPSFPNIYRVCVVRDVYPDAAIEAWTKYFSKKRSSHPRPNCYKEDQAFITIETEDSGGSLGTYPITCCLEAKSIFKQVATAVAVAEEELFFEHRDLHMNNILIKECNEEELVFKLRNKRHVIKTYGVKATIIDFTYSRISTTDGIKFMDLNNVYDPEPDSPRKFLDHHFVYSQMEEITRSQWSTFSPKTNILWLKHVAECLWQELKDKDPTSNEETASQISLLVYNRTCLSYESASEFVGEIVAE